MSDVMEKDFILFASRAHALLEQNKADNALHLCEAGVRRFPRYADGHMVLGMCYRALDRVDEARVEFERALTFAPNNLAAMRALADINRQNGLHQIARDWQMKNLMYFPYNEALQQELAGELAALPQNPPTEAMPQEEAAVDELLSEVDDEESGEEAFLIDEVEEESAAAPEEESGDEASLFEEPAPGESIVGDEQSSDRFDPLADEPMLDNFESRVERPDLSNFDKTDEDFAVLMTDMFSPESAESAPEESGDEEWLEVQDIIIEEEATTEPTLVEEESSVTDEAQKLISELESSAGEDDALLMDDEPLPPETEAAPVYKPEPQDMPPEETREEDVTIEKLMNNPNLITPTFGEILIAQKKFVEARHVFMELSKKEPDNPRFVRKISFLDKFLQVH
ncbi:MAG TPA: tetratricopeptide repeat protein [Caldithrix abyssi]|uniref:Tetratricopeptide repeat protein n=1 Tax=Caldithrix abyssi TaxID=187145 RepID=A0A7V1LMH8_CALAY|nr:tetratricopeptide repeat protein [Caldithrix abyssi]